MSWWRRTGPSWADLTAVIEQRDRLREQLDDTERARFVLKARYQELAEALDKSRAEARELRDKVEQLEASVRLRDAAVRARDWQLEQQRERARGILKLATEITAAVQTEAEPAPVPDEDDDGIPF